MVSRYKIKKNSHCNICFTRIYICGFIKYEILIKYGKQKTQILIIFLIMTKIITPTQVEKLGCFIKQSLELQASEHLTTSDMYINNVIFHLLHTCHAFKFSYFIINLQYISFRQIGGFHRVLRFTPRIKLTATI